MLKRPTFKSLEELAQPELWLAGLRINPKNNDSSRPFYTIGLTILELATGRSVAVVGLPEPIHVEHVQFSPEGKYLALIQARPEGLSLWVVELSTGKTSRVTPGTLSASLGGQKLPGCGS
jgi:Tol biopolymer transport system component